MNYFTKEELILLRKNIVVPEKTGEKGIILEVYRKITMMIDNYCEHKDIRKISDADYVTLCCKCEEVLDYD